MLVVPCVSMSGFVGLIPRSGNVFFAHEQRCWAVPLSQWKINLCNISRPHSLPRWSDRFMPHVLLIFVANKLVWQVALFLTSIHKINNIYAHQKKKICPYMELNTEPPKGYIWDYKHNYHDTNMPYLCDSLYDIWPATKDEKPFPCCLWVCVYQHVMFVLLTLIIPRFIFSA